MRLLLAALAAFSVLAHPPDHKAELAAVRAWALQYTNALPDYTCEQITTRTTTPTRGTTRPRVDVVDEQVGFVKHQEVYELIAINGHATHDQDHSQLGGIFSDGEFGSLLDNTFDPQSKTSFRWKNQTTREGRLVNEFSFRVPAAHGYGIVEENREASVAYEGTVYADAKSGEVVRMEMKCVGIPRGFVYERVDLALDLKPTEIAGKQYMLPARHAMHSRTNTLDYTNEAIYKSCRRFEVQSTVKFGEADKQEQRSGAGESRAGDSRP